MKKFKDIEKQIINDLIQQDVLNIPIFISYIKHYFKNNHTAIFATDSPEKVYILYKTQEDYKKAIKLIIDIVSLLEYLEKDGYIYCIKVDINQPFFVNESSEVKVGIDSDKDSYTISNGKLKIEEGEKANFYAPTYDLVLSGNCCQKELSDKILHYFTCVVYPTESLHELVHNKFETLEMISYKREIKEVKISRNFAWAALIISLFSPFGMTFFNNKFAKTEITEYQYKEILQKIDNLSKCFNSFNEHNVLLDDSVLNNQNLINKNNDYSN